MLKTLKVMKMVSKKQSNKAKGAKAESQFKDILHSWGFLDEQIEKARPTYKPIGGGRMISSQNDFYNEFDFMVKHKAFTMYVQVKAGDYVNDNYTMGNVSTAKKSITEFITKYGMATDMFIIAQKIDRKGFLLRHIDCDDEFKREFINFKGVSCDDGWVVLNKQYDKNMVI